jgi:hypothetical protein
VSVPVIVKLASESDADFATVVGTANVPPVALFACARRTSGPEPVTVVDEKFVLIGSSTAPPIESVPELERKSPLPEIGAPSVRLL